MQIAYEYEFQTPRQTVWAHLQDEDTLRKTLPGCQSFEQVGENVYAAELGLSVGPVKGVFNGEVTLTDKDEPESYRLLLKGQGKPGEINADARIVLHEAGDGTRLTCEADVQVTGVLASFGQRVMNGIAKLILGQFFKGVTHEMKQSAS